METLLPTQPENYIKLINRSLLLYKKSFKHVILLSLLLAVIAFVPRMLSITIGQDIFLNLNPLDAHRLWLFIINLFGLIFFLSILWRIHGVICNAHEPLKEDLALGVRKVFYVLIAAVIQFAILFATTSIIFGAQLLVHEFLLPAPDFALKAVLAIIFIIQFFLVVYVYTLFIFLAPLIAIENKHVFSALRRSVYLVWDHWWRTFSVQVTPWLCYLIALITIKFYLSIPIHIYFFEQLPHSLWPTIFHIVLFALFIPWAAAILIVQLKDLELRKKIIENAYS